MEILRKLFGSGDFMPHGMCYLWNARLIYLHVISDSLIALSYFAIPVILVWLVRKRRNVPFRWMFVLFGVFIVACGTTHLMEVWTLWHGDYWLSGIIKAITAVASVSTAILLLRVVPEVIDLPDASQWIKANAALEKEVRERREAELDLRISEANYREQAEILDLTHDAIFVRSLDARIIYWNRSAEQLYGWTKREARGRVPHELLKTAFPRPLSEIQDEVLREGFWEGELIHERRDGSKITVSSRWALRTNAAGEPVSVLESNRDISQRKEEEEKFRNLLESAPDAMVIVDNEGLIQLVNAQTETLFGYSRAELVGQTVERLIPQRYHAPHVGHRQGYSQSPRPRSMGAGLDLYGRRKDGTEFPVEISLSPLKTRDETLILSAIRDVTQRKEEEERFRNLLESAPDAMVIVDTQGHVQLINAQTERLFGYAREEMIGKPVEMLMPQRFHREHVGHRRLYSDAPQPREMGAGLELLGRRKDGTEFPIEISLSPLKTPGGTLISSAIRDVSDRRQAEEQIRKLNSALEDRVAQLDISNKELESFSYSVSHDLRAPLRHIDGFARILKEEHAAELSSEGIRYLDRVLGAANHMGRLVDDLINLARIGRREVAKERIHLEDVVRQVIAELHPETDERKIEWLIEPLVHADCDPGLIKIVFANLLSNAVKFTRGRENAVIEVGECESRGVPAYFVRDNGAGFDQKYADKLFGVFQRLHRQEEFEGTGIGLATVQRIIRRHGGDIWSESELDRGATFFFTLGDQAGQHAPRSETEVTLGRIESR
ncbi:MAG: PAS domain S-box protein [Candidatus Acidiferrales bacterium]